MNRFPLIANKPSEPITEIVFPPEFGNVSWAGPCAVDWGTFCFGSDNGQVWTTDSDGRLMKRFPTEFCQGEAVNGIAFQGSNRLVVSTRSLIAACCIEGNNLQHGLVQQGAHDVIAAENGMFYALIGAGGFLGLSPTYNGTLSLKSFTPRQSNYVYRGAVIRTHDFKDVLVTANRKFGFGQTLLTDDPASTNCALATEGTLDIVDVSPIRYRGSDGCIAIGKDGRLVILQHAGRGTPGLLSTVEEFQGVAYRVVAFRGLACILSSKSLMLIDGLIDNFVYGRVPEDGIFYHRYGLDAVDMNVVAGRWLLVVLTDRILRFDLEYGLRFLTGPLGPAMSINPKLQPSTWTMTGDGSIETQRPKARAAMALV